MPNLPYMNEDQHERALALIKEHCCNYDKGECIIINWPFCAVCPQSISFSVNCKHFREAILPQDSNLQAAVMEGRGRRYCAICGLPIYPKSGNTKYCPECAIEQRRKRTRERVRKHRKKGRV